MLGQTVFYTFSDADRSALGALRQQTYAAVVSGINDEDDTVTLHVFFQSPERPVMVRGLVRAGDPGQPGTWSSEVA